MHIHTIVITINKNCKIKYIAEGAREMAQRLRALAAFPEEEDSVPNTHIRRITTTCTYLFTRSELECLTQIHTPKIYTHLIRLIKSINNGLVL